MKAIRMSYFFLGKIIIFKISCLLPGVSSRFLVMHARGCRQHLPPQCCGSNSLLIVTFCNKFLYDLF